MRSRCRGVGLETKPEGRDFRARVSWEALELRWHTHPSPSDVRGPKHHRALAPPTRSREPRLSPPQEDERTRLEAFRDRVGFVSWRSSPLLTTVV